MKQPELGKKISEMRKAKGLTQEELVELCNLNVRTIQRIEAGEVTPRSYTMKAIFEALGMEWAEEKEVQKLDPKVEYPSTFQRWIYISFGAGILYFFVSLVEFPMEMTLIGGVLDLDFSMDFYYIIKVASLIFYTVFLIGFVKIADHSNNVLLKVATWVMIISNIIGVGVEISLAQSGDQMNTLSSIFYVGSFGVVFMLFGFSLVQSKPSLKSVVVPVGVLGMVTGFLFITVIGAILGALTQVVFEIGMIYFLYWYANQIGRTSSPDSTFRPELLP